MKKYLVYGILICALFFAAGSRGFVIAKTVNAPRWGAGGGHTFHHK